MNNYLILFAHATIVALVQRYRILSACNAFPYTIKFECAAGECAAYLQSNVLMSVRKYLKRVLPTSVETGLGEQ